MRPEKSAFPSFFIKRLNGNGGILCPSSFLTFCVCPKVAERKTTRNSILCSIIHGSITCLPMSLDAVWISRQWRRAVHFDKLLAPKPRVRTWFIAEDISASTVSEAQHLGPISLSLSLFLRPHSLVWNIRRFCKLKRRKQSLFLFSMLQKAKALKQGLQIIIHQFIVQPII